MVTVGLLWHSLSSGNLGVGALTESNIAIVRSVADQKNIRVRFIVFGVSDIGLPSLKSELEAAGHILECRRIRMFRSCFRKDLRLCDFVLDIGAGDSFSDIYGFKRFLYYWLSKNVVCFTGKPLVLSPQTIGPFDGRLAKILARQAMLRCDHIFARDDISSAYLQVLGGLTNSSEAVDVAFKLPFNKEIKFSNDRFHIGLNVSGLLFNGGYTGTNQFGLTVDYPKVIRGILMEFSKQSDVCLHLVGHVIEPEMPIEDDMAIMAMLAKEFPNVIVAPAFSRPSDAKSYISSLGFFAGARMHACIAAFSSGVPVVPMAYSRKFNGLFGSLEYEYIADLKVLDDTQAIAAVVNGFKERRDLAIAVKRGNKIAELRIKKYEDYLGAIFSKIKNDVSTCFQKLIFEREK